jgi:hypothetical protein
MYPRGLTSRAHFRRTDPAGRDEQYEHLYIGLLRSGSSKTLPACRFYRVGETGAELRLDTIIEDCFQTIAIRNADMYTSVNGRLEPAGKPRKTRRRDERAGEDGD